MRPRFSLKWLLIAFTVMSVTFYTLFIHPSVRARRFVKDFETGGTVRDAAFASAANSKLVHPFALVSEDIHARVDSGTWSDVWHFRRRIQFDVDPHDKRIPIRSWGYQMDAGVAGLQLRGAEINNALIVNSRTGELDH